MKRPPIRSELWPLFALLGIGFILRLFFMHDDGFHADVSSFEGWAMTVAEHPLRDFYAKAGFADYPPGYFYVLWIVGHIYEPFKAMDPSFSLLRYLVKLPAILMDLAVGYTIFQIVQRFAGLRWALGAAAAYVLNPAVIFISASWGQVDSIAGGLGLIAMNLILRSDDEDEKRATWLIASAWLLLAYSLLIKPQGIMLAPLFLTFAFANPARRVLRLRATGYGILGGFVLAWLVSVPFHPALNPISIFGWLLERYRYGSNVYAYNSVNAFNLWTIRYPFWQHDDSQVLFFAQYLWGILLLGAATVLILLRYLQSGTQRVMIESAALLTLAFFMLLTRMHERYVFDGLLFTIVAIFIGRRYLVAAAIVSATLFANLVYSMQYMAAMEQHWNLDVTNLWPHVTNLLSLANVGVFFFLGYVFLGGADAPSLSERAAPVADAQQAEDKPQTRSWFDPREGLAAMRWPLDYAIAVALGAVSFVLSYVGYARITEKIFDEIYFARAAEEYLKHWYIYENTHPPLTKLLVTLSVIMFGGLAHGDNSAGWRFLDVVFGSLMVSLLYIFAKRITRSSLFAAIAAVLLVADGMHFVQSRIATPESFVGFFALATLYTFYRYWIASQVRTAQEVEGTQLRNRIIGTVACFALALIAVTLRFPTESPAAKIVATIYLFAGLYLLLRGVILPRFFGRGRAFTSYPDGTAVKSGAEGLILSAPDGGRLDSQKGPVAGDLSANLRGALVLRDDELTETYRKDGSLEYATPVAAARFTPSSVTIDEEPVALGNPRLWLFLFAVSITCLVTSKWYGIMAYPVTLGIIAWVWLQPHVSAFLKNYFGRKRRPARWGNPFGFPLDVILSTVLFVGGTIYFATYTPQFIGLKDTPASAPRAYSLTDVVNMQQQMYDYHSTLKATHPYSSVWWQWPLDLRPIAYYWKDNRGPGKTNDEKACCVEEITSLPNPVILWFGLFTVPFVGVLAYREKNKGYLLLVVAYLLQWLPWMRSPRISFAYHFYVDIAVICLCNAIALQHLWAWGVRNPESKFISRAGTFGYVAAAVLAFAFFYPLLAGSPMPWDQWNIRTLPWLMHSGWV